MWLDTVSQFRAHVQRSRSALDCEAGRREKERRTSQDTLLSGLALALLERAVQVFEPVAGHSSATEVDERLACEVDADRGEPRERRRLGGDGSGDGHASSPDQGLPCVDPLLRGLLLLVVVWAERMSDSCSLRRSSRWKPNSHLLRDRHDASRLSLVLDPALCLFTLPRRPARLRSGAFGRLALGRPVRVVLGLGLQGTGQRSWQGAVLQSVS